MRHAVAGLLLCGIAGAQAQTASGTAAAVDFGFDIAGMDRSASPGNDFFQFANGTYVAGLVIPADKTSYGSFNKLADLAEQQVHALLAEAAAGGSPQSPAQAKAGAFFTAFMDADAVERRGTAPLQPYLAAIRQADGKPAMAALMGQSRASFFASLVRLSIDPDARDPTRYSVGLEQAGLGLPDRDYYLKPEYAERRARYTDYVAAMLGMADWPDAAATAKAVVAFETRIAEVSWARADRRDPDRTYNPATPSALAETTSGFDWQPFLAAAGVPSPDFVVLSEDTAIAAIAKLAGDTDLAMLQGWEAFHVVANAASILPARFVDASFAFNSTYLKGVPTNSERWKRALRATNLQLGEAVGELYVARHFPPASMAKMERLTEDLKAAYRARLAVNEWMVPATREKALAKLDKFATQIGYPKKWLDYSAYEVRAGDLFGNLERGKAFEWHRLVSRLGGKVDRDEWDMTPQTVNAYNNPNFNEIVFPAAILQPPFFDADADPAVNYGAIGGVIGHEMTHGFDDEGRKFDEDGRLRNWWTAEDIERFDALAAKLGAEYAAMTPLPGAHINPKLTMGENIADLGGLTLALDAYHASLHGAAAPVIDGLSGDQRVFLGWAQVWRAKQRPEAERQSLLTDPHSPPDARVNGPAANIDAWYGAFGVKPGDALYIKPENRVRIW